MEPIEKYVRTNNKGYDRYPDFPPSNNPTKCEKRQTRRLRRRVRAALVRRPVSA